MSTEKIKHLEFIQNIITRLNTNSFQIKGMAITIVAVLLAVYTSTKNSDFIIIPIFPTILFWFLDTYYLQQERKFRGLYNDVAGVSDNPKQIKPFEMRPDLYTGGKYSYWNVFWLTTLWKLYLNIILALSGIFAYLKYIN